MKKLVSIILFFILFTSQAQEADFIGKWVHTHTDYYSNDKLDNIEKAVPNKKCVSYIEFTKEGQIIPQMYSLDCSKQKDNPGTYKYNDGFWTLSQKNETYNVKLITGDNNDLQMIMEIKGEEGFIKKIIVNFLKYDYFIVLNE